MIIPRGRDTRREVEEQAAFEEAERRRAELRAAATFDSFIDSSPVAIELFDSDGRPIRSNKAAERLLGKVPPPGITLFEERGLKRAGLLEPQVKRILAGARVETPPTWYDPTEIGLPGVPGRKVCFRATVFPLFDAEGNVTRIAVLHEDLTELKRLEESAREAPVASVAEATTPASNADPRDIEFARRKLEAALRDSEERYRSLIESARGHAIIRFAEDGRIIAASPSIQDITGVSRETVITDSSALFAQVHPDDIARVREVEAQVRRTGQYPPNHRFRIVNKSSGAQSWVEMRGAVCTFASRRTFEVILLDITVLKQTQELIQEHEASIATLAASAADAVVTIDKDWVVTAWSPGAEQETRFSANETLGRRLWDIYPDLEKSGIALLFRRTLLERAPQHSKELFYQDGREKYAAWFAVSTYPIPGGALGIFRNVTQRRKVEQAWRDTESRLRALMDNPTAVIALKDKSLRYVAANVPAQRLLGSSLGGTSIIGKTDAELFPSAVTGLLSSHDRQVLERNESVTVELALGDPKSDLAVWLHLTKQPWRDAAGTVIGILDLGFDITRMVRAIQELTRRRDYVEKLLAEQAQTLNRAQAELSRWAR
uniref:PAS domain S-box protein n=1 Tax=candidate division WOR-3 bacterium TaxID=2052148 RepID=A0A7C4GF92_UNCW3